MKKLLFTLATISIMVASCKKYDNGPVISLRTVEQRITGTWVADKWVQNDIALASTEQIQLGFNKDHTASYFYYDSIDGYSESYTGTWQFDEGNEHLTIELNSGNAQQDITIYCIINTLSNSTFSFQALDIEATFIK